MGADNKTSLKDVGRLLKVLFTTAKIGSGPFWSLAFTACTVKFILYVLSQTLVPAGTPLSTRLSLDGDLLCLAVALLAMCRARDAKMRGLFGFLGSLISFFEVGVLLVFSFKGAGIYYFVIDWRDRSPLSLNLRCLPPCNVRLGSQ